MTKIQAALMSCQVLKHMRLWLGRKTKGGVSPQEHGSVGQQGHGPSQPQTIEKSCVQTQLIFFIRLRGLNPGTHLLQEPLCGPTRQGQQAEQGFMLTGCERKLTRATRGFPALRAIRRRLANTEPMLVQLRGILQPLQGLTLVTLRSVPSHIRRRQLCVGVQSGDHRHIKIFSAFGLESSTHVAHVCHHNFWPPAPTSPAINQTRNQQRTLENIGRCDPTHQRHQPHRRSMLPPPQPQCMFFVPHVPATLTRFVRAHPHGCTLRRVGLRLFFLKPSQAASKSVASIKATACAQPDACLMNWPRNWSLIFRSPATPARARNSLSIRTSGTRCRCDNLANVRQARCSGKSAINWLSECTGVKTASKCVRHNCAALKYRRGPRAERGLTCWLIKLSGTNGSKILNSSAAPVIGNFAFIGPEPILRNDMCLRIVVSNKFLPQLGLLQRFSTKLVTPSN